MKEYPEVQAIHNDSEPSYCPFCSSSDVRFTNGLQVEDGPTQEEIHLDEYQCMNCTRSFFV